MKVREKVRRQTAIALLMVGVGLLLIAYFDVLNDDKRKIANVFYQIVAASLGWVYAGLALTLIGGVGQAWRFGVRAVNGSGLFVLAVLFPLFPPRPANGQIAVLEPRIEITRPAANARVAGRDDVCGRSTETGRLHYISIQPTHGGAQRQDAVLRPADSGEFCGKASFGSALAGAGEYYTIQILASGAPLNAGAPLPRNLIWSAPVTVRRVDSEE